MPSYIKPDNITGLDTGHALYGNIHAFFELGQLDKDLVDDTALTTTATFVDDTHIGDSRFFNSFLDAITETVSHLAEFSILLIYKPTGDLNQFITYMNMQFDGGNKSGLAHSSGGSEFNNFYQGASGTIRRVQTGALYADVGEYRQGHTFVQTFSQTATMTSTFNGVTGVTDVQTTGVISGSPVMSFMTGIGFINAGVNLGGIVVFDKVLSNAEAIDVSDTPWGLVTSGGATGMVLDNIDIDNDIYPDQKRVAIEGSDIDRLSTVKTLTLGGISIPFLTWGKTMYIVICYGQSNVYGFKTADLNVNDTVTESTTAILMMNVANTALIEATHQVPGDEAVDPLDSDCMLDYANYIHNYNDIAEGHEIPQVLQINGVGASTVTELADGTSPFTDWKADFLLIYNLIVAAGYKAHVRTILWVQGERDVNTSVEAGWASRVATTIYDPMVTYINSLTGQPVDPDMQVVALTMHSNETLNGQDLNEIAIEQLALPALRPGKIRATVHTGWLEHTVDGIHYSGKGQRYMRQMQAKFTAYPDLQPLTVTSVARVGSTLEALIGGGDGDLLFDYTIHATTIAKGMRVFNVSVVAVTISSVTLDNTDPDNRKVIVTLADGGTSGPYTIDGSFFSDNELGGGQYHMNIVPITDSDTTRDGVLTDSVSIGNQSLVNPLMPFNMTASEP